jgi:uncharacterized SAM-binding protein YcdF (DUF218 family)
MLFFLRKLAESLILPDGLAALVVILAVILRRRRIALVAAVALCGFSTEAVAWCLLRPLEKIYPPMRVAEAPPADAIVVLAGGIVRGITSAGLQWGTGANRFFTGVDLALANKARRFVISSGGRAVDGEILRRVAVNDGISAERIMVTPVVLTTEEEARAVSQIPGVHSILLVTSAFHMPRAALLFRSRGFAVTPFPTDQREPSFFKEDPLIFIPTASGLLNSETALREYYGLLIYRGLFLGKSASPVR